MSEIKKEKPSKDDLEKLGISSWNNWGCDESVFDWEYDDEEWAYVLEGNVVVKTSTGEVEINAGDLVKFPKGLKCTWDVKKKIRKVYTFK
ncbi:MAG: cupin domain-containing protein [Candidatus Hodarchaeota archaeon]